MKKFQLLRKILNSGIVAIVRTETTEKAIKTVEAIKAGGISVIEVTMTVPNAIDAIKNLVDYCGKEDIILGVGSVLDPETARIAILAGAEYVVTPNVNTDVIKLCNRYQVPIMPGAMTIKEIIEAMEAGADIVKVFPGEMLGPAFIKAVRGPLPQAPLMPTGGVSLDNIKNWFDAGAVAVGIGGSLTEGAKQGNYQLVTDTARRFVEKIQLLRRGVEL
ncbi:MAG: bifunctional 2-keto-4-hydroxyglutarate aldolase/2-keto-3-deoxy-6-phosphogluconate aldolase [Peptococcaceae bacterium]|nr:bifunctional 2-keto-4-hydroxyglutarate aldolase/2-keto-3-deoxy-6-phosphogluconate aldolase [Peptococcaceae bacterium]